MKLWGREAWAIVNDVEVRGMRLVFQAKKTYRPDPATLDLKIYNLAPATRSKLSGVAAPPVILVAGHTAATQVIFSGRARTIDHVREGPDWVTHIQSGDGEQAFSQFGAASFGPGAKLADVVKELAGQAGIEAKDAVAQLRRGDLVGGSKTFLQGYTAAGRSVLDLDRVLKSASIEWSIQDGVLQLVNPGKATQAPAYVLSADSGLIGSPDHGAPGPNGEPPLLKAKCLLNGGITPARAIKLESVSRSGFYRVETVQHTGDTHGQDWTSSIEATAL